MSISEREVIDRAETAVLPDDDPNLAAGASPGGFNHLDFVGGEVEDDDTRAVAALVEDGAA